MNYSMIQIPHAQMHNSGITNLFNIQIDMQV
jgi:hypothetical protein